MSNSMLRAAIAAAIIPAALVADLVTLPVSAANPYRGAFDLTRFCARQVRYHLEVAAHLREVRQ